MENSGTEIRGIRSGTQGEESSHAQSFREKISFQLNSISLSGRALQFFRFGLGFILLYDLIQHFQDIGLFYTRDGILPLEAALGKIHDWHHSIYFLTDHPAAITALYLIHIALAFAFMIGRGLPWVTIALWVFQWSLRNRNFNIADGADDLAIILLFFSIFLPLKQPNTEAVESSFHGKWKLAWSSVLQLQILFLYFFSALQKTDASWTRNFTATFMAFHLDLVTNPFGHAMLQFPTLLKVGTAFSYFLELLGPAIFILCMPFQKRWSIETRKMLCGLFILFHFGLLLTMRLWAFPLLCMLMWTTFYISLTSIEKQPSQAIQPRWKLAFFILPVFILAVILTWNIAELKRNMRIWTPIKVAGRQLSLWQSWGMFAPYPMVMNQELRLIGRGSDGIEKEVLKRDALLENRHRVKLSLNFNTNDTYYLEWMANYFCRQDPDLKAVRFESVSKLLNKNTLVTTSGLYTLLNHDCIQSK